jgi:serine/threonine-protein kinase SRPK3
LFSVKASSTISRSYLDSDASDKGDDDETPNQIVDQKYIINPHIVLADFGNYIPIDSDNIKGYGDVQTRHYRSPEIILRLALNEKMDIWALGCTIYELITCKVLFDPHKTMETTTDIRQLYDMQCLLGIFPQHFYTGRKNNVFFKNDYLLKKFDSIDTTTLKQLLKNNVKENISDRCMENIYKIISACLTYDTTLRPSASQLFDYQI